MRYYKQIKFFFSFLYFSTTSFCSPLIKVGYSLNAEFFANLFLFEMNDLEKVMDTEALSLARKIRQAFLDFGIDTRLSSAEEIITPLIRKQILKIGNLDLSQDFIKNLSNYEKTAEKNSKEIQKKIRKLPKIYEKCNVGKWLYPIKVFYNSVYQLHKAAPFEVFLFSFLKNDFALAFPIGHKYIFLQAFPEDIVIYLGIIVHEICHIFFETRSEAQQRMMDTFFVQHKSPFAILVKQYFDEAIATCIGNRLIVNQISVEYSQNAYCDQYINKYSEALLPLVTEYLRQGKSIDENFLEISIKIFEQTFPKALCAYDALFFDVLIFSNLKKIDIEEQFKKIFSISNINIFTIEEINKKNDKNSVFSIFILKNTQHIPHVTLNNQPDSLYVNKRENCIVIQTDCLENIEKALRFLKAQKYFEKTFLYKLA